MCKQAETIPPKRENCRFHKQVWHRPIKTIPLADRSCQIHRQYMHIRQRDPVLGPQTLNKYKRMHHKNTPNILQILGTADTVQFQNVILSSKDTDQKANSADPDQSLIWVCAVYLGPPVPIPNTTAVFDYVITQQFSLSLESAVLNNLILLV